MMSIRPIETIYRGYRFRSRLEARWAVFFQTLGVRWEYEPEGFTLPTGERYLPDFRIHLADGPLWAEVKPVNASHHKFEQFIGALINSRGTVLHDIPGPEEIDAAKDDDFCVYWNDGAPVHSRHAQELADTVLCDICYQFCICAQCSGVGFEFRGLANRIGCSCKTDEHYNAGDSRILVALRAARSARFEHGETPDLPSSTSECLPTNALERFFLDKIAQPQREATIELARMAIREHGLDRRAVWDAISEGWMREHKRKVARS